MGRPKGRGRGARGRGTGRGRGRPRKNKLVIDSDEEQEQMETSDTEEKPVETADDEETSTQDDTAEESTITTSETPVKDTSHEFNIDDDISQLVPPTFSTISKGPPQPMLELSWDHVYMPMGEKVASPNIHMCITCKLPIRLYGRLIPCKHIFCHTCAVKQGDRCSCCDDRVIRVEKAPLGSVFMCLHGGIQFGYDGCRRTYLSPRDLQSHVDHRHKPRASSGSGGGSSSNLLSSSGGKSSSSSSNALNTSSSSILNDVQSPVHSSANSTPIISSHRQSIPVHYAGSSGRSNLISVPLQSGPTSSGGGSGGPNSRQQSLKDGHPDNRYERKPVGSGNYSHSRNNPSSGWGSFRPY